MVCQETGARFVVHPNTIRIWQKAIDDKVGFGQLIGGPPWNRLHDGVRWLIQNWHLNAKVERVFRDVKHWAKRSSLVPTTESIQQRLDAFREWHNGFKPYAAHGTLTP